MAPVVMVAGAAMSAIGQLQQAQTAKAVGRYNQQLGERSAGIARGQTAAEITRQQRHARRVQGAARAAAGASGVTMEGSPLDVLEDNATQAELDTLTLKYRGELRAQGYEQAGSMERFKGDSSARAGRMAAAGTLLSSYGSKGAPGWWGGS